MTSRRSYETRNRVCDMLLKVAGPYAPSHVIILYYNRLEQRFVRAVEGISNFDTLRLVLWEDDMPDVMRIDGVFNEGGYRYVCSRIKSSEITPQELSDLKKAKAAYEILNEMRKLVNAAKKGDGVKVNRILNKGATV